MCGLERWRRTRGPWPEMPGANLRVFAQRSLHSKTAPSPPVPAHANTPTHTHARTHTHQCPNSLRAGFGVQAIQVRRRQGHGLLSCCRALPSTFRLPRSKRPVGPLYGRAGLKCTTRRHGSGWVRHKSSVRRDVWCCDAGVPNATERGCKQRQRARKCRGTTANTGHYAPGCA